MESVVRELSFPLAATTTGLLSVHADAKAGENVGQAKPREDMTEKAKQTDQQKNRSRRFSLTRSSSRFVGVLRLLPRLSSTSSHG